MRCLWLLTRNFWLGSLFLRLLAYFYHGAIALRDWGLKKGWLKPKTLAAPVISVGNLTAGGTGKTTLAAYLSRGFMDRGRSVCLLTRGYKGADEALMLGDRFASCNGLFHIGIGVDRYNLALSYLRQRQEKGLPDPVFILDDGHQHWRLHRHFRLITINALDGDEVYEILPLGLLREPWASGIKNADAVVMTGADAATCGRVDALRRKIISHKPGMPVFLTTYEVLAIKGLKNGFVYDLASFAGRSVALLSAIGNPHSFEQTVARKLNARIERHFIFEDHAAFSEKTLLGIMQWLGKHGESLLLTTEKDAVRLRGLPLDRLLSKGQDILAVNVGLRFLEKEEQFWKIIEKGIRGHAILD